MNECGESMVRAGGVALLALGSAMALRGLLRSGVRTGWVWGLLMIPLGVPTILIGYAFSPVALAWIRHPWLKEALYGLLLWWRWTPVATLALCFAPTGLSEEAWHCHRLSRGLGRGWREAPAFWLRGPGQPEMVAFLVVFLLGFNDFEISSLLYIPTWTVVVFDAHAGGLPLVESLRMTRVPLCVEGILLLVVLVLLAAHRGRGMGTIPRKIQPERGTRVVAWSCLGIITGVGMVLPWRLLRDTLTSVPIFGNTRVIVENVLASLLFAGVAAAVAFWLAGRRIQTRLPMAILVSVPSLLGALVMSLGILFLFQESWLHGAYGSPVPLLLGLTLLLFPYALLLRLLLAALQPGAAVHAAGLLHPAANLRGRARALLWVLENRRRFWVAALLFWWAYFDLTVSAILEPVGMTPVAVRLYNFLHYGQSPALAAMVMVAILAPLILLSLAGGAQGLFSRMNPHE